MLITLDTVLNINNNKILLFSGLVVITEYYLYLKNTIFMLNSDKLMTKKLNNRYIKLNILEYNIKRFNTKICRKKIILYLNRDRTKFIRLLNKQNHTMNNAIFITTCKMIFFIAKL